MHVLDQYCLGTMSIILIHERFVLYRSFCLQDMVLFWCGYTWSFACFSTGFLELVIPFCFYFLNFLVFDNSSIVLILMNTMVLIVSYS